MPDQQGAQLIRDPGPFAVLQTFQQGLDPALPRRLLADPDPFHLGRPSRLQLARGLFEALQLGVLALRIPPAEPAGHLLAYPCPCVCARGLHHRSASSRGQRGHRL
ncbi:hypothetical protein [Streptomyces diastaticus]|uniref:hypothetical protein n=1 Tax=Streptomyces diastaticus TaxID=1956 RepID=UPI003649F61F